MPQRTSSAFTAFLLLLVLFSSALHAQNYTRIVVFGDSLSDTGNVARLAQNKYGARLPGPLFGYTDGRFTDGSDTLPPASLYTGVWVEQLATLLATKPAIKASLDGGTDYAYGSATTANGTTVDSYGSFSLTLNNMGQQVTDYLATKPNTGSTTLHVLWGGANDLLNATSTAAIAAAAANEVNQVQTLIAAGGTDFLVVGLPPLGLTPRLNSNAMAAAQANAASQGFNAAVFAGLQQLSAANSSKGVHIFTLDTYTLLNGIVAAPAANGFDNVTAKAQFASVNPDRYLFWDDIHPTTAGHHLLALAALKLITPVTVTTATTLTSSAATSNLNSSITLTATVTAQSGTPTGTVTFLDGTATLGTGTLASSTGTTATATFSIASLGAGQHSLTATYAGATGFAGSTSAVLTQTVVAPALSATLSPTALTITRGSSGTVTINATPVGGYSGTVALACGTLPKNMTCSFSPASITLSGNNQPQTSTLTVGTQAMAADAGPGFGFRGAQTVAACGLLMLGLAMRRNGTRGVGLLLLLLVAGAVGSLGLSGCGGNDNRVSAGTYTVPVILTSNNAPTTLNLSVTVQ